MAKRCPWQHTFLKNAEWKNRINVIDATQFLTTKMYEKNFFKAEDWKTTLSNIPPHYNEIVAACATDAVLQIRF